jgi:hypothetical protein
MLRRFSKCLREIEVVSDALKDPRIHKERASFEATGEPIHPTFD